MVHVDFKMFLDRAKVMKAIDRKRRRVLSKVGGFTRTAMQRSIKPAPKRKKPRTYLVRGVPCIVPFRGKVTDSRTGRPVPRAIADEARVVASRQRTTGAGKPPRSRSGELRQHIYFGVDDKTESVVIGPMKFGKQPDLVNAASVPDLLNKGGGQRIAGSLVRYSAHPFVGPLLPLAEKKLSALVKSEPFG